MGLARRVTATVMLACCLAAVVPLRARAEEPEAQQALALAEEGLALYEAERWSEAFERFRRANDRFPAVTLSLYMAHCKKQLGELLAARRLYREVAQAELPPDAKRQHVEAKSTAADELRALEARIPTLEIVISGAREGQEPVVTVDGRPVAAGELKAKQLDPGQHTVEATAPGLAPAAATVELAEGQAERIVLTFHPPDSAPPPAEEGSLVPAMVAFGVGGAGLLMGIITGSVSLGQVSDLQERCQPDNHCPAADQDEADTAYALATVSTVGFVVAGIGAAAGVALLVWRPSLGDDDEQGMALRVGPASLALTGTF